MGCNRRSPPSPLTCGGSLQLLVCGLPDIVLEDWRHYTAYEGDFHTPEGASEHPVIGWFWEVVSDFSQENKARLLQFATGTSRVPAQGFKVRHWCQRPSLRRRCAAACAAACPPAPTRSPATHPLLPRQALQSNDGHSRLFTLKSVAKSISIMPRSHTCFNRIDLPVYADKAELARFLEVVINMEVTGFSIE